MSFTTPDFQAIRDGYLRDIGNQLPGANVASDGDYYIRGNAIGGAVEGLYQHQQWILRQIFADTADSDYLEKHASRKSLYRKAATLATGTITFSGQVGSPVPIGTEAKTVSGVAYMTTAADVIGANGTVTIAATAEVVGSAGNQATAASLTLTSAPSGVVSAATGVFSGGTDIETDASLLSRLLFVLRNPPCGGAAHDYYTWAMNVSGVTAAYVYPSRRGLGTVDVVILTSGGVASAALLATVQAYIDSQRPVTAGCLVLAYTPVPVNVAASLVLASGYTSAAVQAAILTQLAAYFAGFKPGDTVYANKIRSLISDTAGVVDFTMTAPAANVVATVDTNNTQMAVLGTVAWS